MTLRRCLAQMCAVSMLVLAACSSGESGGNGDGDEATPESSSTPVPSMTATAMATIPPSETPASQAQEPQWAWTGSEWTNLGGPAPECPSPIAVPIDLSLATSTLYPGQVRGDYKAHGGFRFDGLAPDDIEVRSPIDGVLVRAAQYLASGEIQYTLDFIHPCGLMVRFGHLRELTPKWTEVFKDYPAPVELDSRSTYVNPPVPVEEGELVGIAVGVYGTNNTFVDLGMYDLRQRNEASSDPAWLAEHNNDTYAYGLCWFDLTAPEVADQIYALPPADGALGTKSDYCTRP